LTTPTSLSTDLLRRRGYEVAFVQTYIRIPGRRVGFYRDLFGLFDLLGIGADTLAVQTTSADNISARVRKIETSPLLETVQRAGWRIEVHGWEKDSTGHWQLRCVDLTDQPVDWSRIQKAGRRSKARPAIQTHLF